MKPDQAMRMAMEEPDLEPCDLFMDLGMLIIEGRTPLIGTSRGYGEGPHCFPAVTTPLGSSIQHQRQQAVHVCNLQNPQCAQQEGFRKHMLLLWKNNIPMSIEVLLCPDCCHGVDKLGEAAAGPEPTFVLLEQWTVQMFPRRLPEMSIVPRALMQAVRSYLHFSQLSAWYSQTGGRDPKNVVYRVCVPGEAFSNKFSKPPDEHVFPMSNVGWSNILKVSVKTMPRAECVPHVFCPLHNNLVVSATQGHQRSRPAQVSMQCAETKKFNRLSPDNKPNEDSLNYQQQQRRCSFNSTSLDGPVVRKEIQANQADCMIGDSLLDPPQCLEMYPKRYQSPSRSGSPVMETPEHWLFGGHHLRGRSQKRDLTLDGKVVAQRERCNKSFRRVPSSCKNSKDLHGLEIEESLNKKITGKGSVDRSTREEVDCYVSKILRECDSPKRFLSHLKRRPFSRLAAKFQNVNYDEEVDYSHASSSSSSCDLSDLIHRAKLVEKSIKKSTNELTPQSSPLSSTPSFQTDKRSFVYVKGSLPISPLVRDALTREHKRSVSSTDLEALRQMSLMRDGSLTTSRSFQFETSDSMKSVQNHSSKDDDDDYDEDGGRINDLIAIDQWSNICDRPMGQFSNEDDLVGAITANHSQSVERKDFSSEDEEFNGNVVVHLRKEVPSAVDKAKFRRSLDSAAYLVFHARTGLPLTSSPAPVRRGNSFDFDSSLTSVSAIKHALFDKDVDETVAEEEEKVRFQLSTSAPTSLANNSNLLGNFEESVLNGRLEPVSTVEGFTAEIGASGSFCPRHIVRQVTVFFYTLSDVDKVSTPYLTLFNPHGTVVKMFVVMYDLRDMPVRCQTFLRQRTLYMPVDASDDDPEARKWLRYLIHLRFASSKSGRIYLHTDIRMVIFRKSDMDVANIHGKVTYELRSFTKGPTMPRFSPRR